MQYSNAQKLAAVVSHWARPAITQLATSRLASLPMVQNLQQMAIGSGLVSSAYNISADLMPLVQPLANNLLQPYLCRIFAQVPDEALPQLARDILAEAERQGSYSIMDGFLTLELQDIRELQNLVNKNLPLPSSEAEQYQPII